MSSPSAFRAAALYDQFPEAIKPQKLDPTSALFQEQTIQETFRLARLYLPGHVQAQNPHLFSVLLDDFLSMAWNTFTLHSAEERKNPIYRSGGKSRYDPPTVIEWHCRNIAGGKSHKEFSKIASSEFRLYWAVSECSEHDFKAVRAQLRGQQHALTPTNIWKETKALWKLSGTTLKPGSAAESRLQTRLYLRHLLDDPSTIVQVLDFAGSVSNAWKSVGEIQRLHHSSAFEQQDLHAETKQESVDAKQRDELLFLIDQVSSVGDRARESQLDVSQLRRVWFDCNPGVTPKNLVQKELTFRYYRFKADQHKKLGKEEREIKADFLRQFTSEMAALEGKKDLHPTKFLLSVYETFEKEDKLKKATHPTVKPKVSTKSKGKSKSAKKTREGKKG